MVGDNPQSTTPQVSTAGQRYAWHRQRLLRAAIATLLAAPVAVAAGWAFAKYAKPPALAGAVVTPPIQAADFHLKNQHGSAVSMSALHGKVVALGPLDEIARRYAEGDVAEPAPPQQQPAA